MGINLCMAVRIAGSVEPYLSNVDQSKNFPGKFRHHILPGDRCGTGGKQF